MRRCSNWFGAWLALWLLALAMPLMAKEDIYSAAVAVKSQSASERARAASKGLAQVMVRVSGVVDIKSAGNNVDHILDNASRYIEQFHYQRTTDDYGGKAEQLVMSFTPAVIERLLRQANLPLWPINRPKVLVWLVVDDPERGRQLVGEGDGEVAKGLRKGAADRGVQLKWPLLDLDDQLAINADNVWTFDQEAILAASERYRVDTILVGRYTQTSKGQWWTSWQFFHRGDNEFYDLRVDDGVQAGQQAIAPIADYLADRYSVFSNAEGEPELMVQVSSVDDFGDFRGTLNYLRQLAVITSLRLLAVSGSTLVVAVQLGGDEQQLQNALSLDRKLRLETVQTAPDSPWISVPTGTATNPLRLEWIGR